MNAESRLSTVILIAAVLAVFAPKTTWSQTYSQVRIVRLSFVEGNVTVQRPDVQGWAEAPVNTPIQQGFRLSTGENSYAEVQFENGGTIRLGQLGLIDFTELALASDGSKVNKVNLRQGYATFHPLPSHSGETLQVETPYAILAAQGGTAFRVDLDQGIERVEALSGAVEVQGNLANTTLEKNHVLELQPGAPEPTAVSEGITKDDWDAWVEDRDNQSTLEAAGPPPGGYMGDAEEPPYGWTDLLQYGTWAEVPGAGYGWMPNWISVGWSPYTMGQWCWYPGWGYTWIGSEPWAWLPYHYGGWEFVSGRGWIWFPGSLRRWSPGKVTWFHGPGWVGWVPRPLHKDKVMACESNCGGAAVSSAAFRHGGLLTSNLLLPVNPTTGATVKEPGISPSTALKLPGPAVSQPAAQSRTPRPGPAWNAAAPPVFTAPPRHQTTANSAIVYDSRQAGYVNGRPAPTSPPSPPSGSGITHFQVSNPGLAQPPANGNQAEAGKVGEGQVPDQARPRWGTIPASPRTFGGAAPASPSNSPARQAPSLPSGNASAGRGGGGQSGIHFGGTASGGHSSPSPSGGGGGHAGGGAGGGGHH